MVNKSGEKPREDADFQEGRCDLPRVEQEDERSHVKVFLLPEVLAKRPHTD